MKERLKIAWRVLNRPSIHYSKTCIDCHKGIAHRLPDMAGVEGF